MRKFDGRIMDVSRYPTATFTLTAPIDLSSLPTSGVTKQYSASGTLDLHGVSRSVTFPLQAEVQGSNVAVLGDITVPFAKWNIANPSIGGFVTTAESGHARGPVDPDQGSRQPRVDDHRPSRELGRRRTGDRAQHDGPVSHRAEQLTDGWLSWRWTLQPGSGPVNSHSRNPFIRALPPGPTCSFRERTRAYGSPARRMSSSALCRTISWSVAIT